MKRYSCAVLVMMMLVWGGVAEARVTQVELYPAGGRVFAEETCQAGTVEFALPASARPETLVIAAPAEGFQVAGVRWAREKPAEGGEVRKLRERLDQLEQQRAAQDAARKTVEARIGFWQAQLARQWETADDALTIAERFAGPLEQSYGELTAQNKALKELDEQIREVRRKIDELLSPEHGAWLVQAQVRGPRDLEVKLGWSCMVDACGYRPVYRLEALPEKGRVQFAWEAEVWQQTGQDWDGVELALASVAPGGEIAPDEVAEWIAVPLDPLVRQRTLMAPRAFNSAGKAMDMEAAVDAVAVREEQHSTYVRWLLGRQRIKAGPARRVAVRDEQWPATFSYVLRPAQDARAYLQASVELEKARQIPAGAGQFFVEGTLVGRRTVAFEGRTHELFFGPDSLVRARRQLVEKETGERGVLRGRQTWHWRWETEVENARKVPVRVLVEEARPQARDERIRVTVQAEPAVSEQTHRVLRWDRELAPGTRENLILDVRFEAPEDMTILPGR